MAITPLPSAPQRGDAPDVFATKADNFLTALGPFAAEANALADDVSAKHAAATAAGAAATAAEQAVAAAAMAAEQAVAGLQAQLPAGAISDALSSPATAFSGQKTAQLIAPASSTPGYNADGTIASVTDATAQGNRVTSFTYDTAGRVATATITLGTNTRTETYTYDATGMLTGMTATGDLL